MSRDPYEVLGVTRTATAEEIKKAYRKIVRTSHPDLNPDDAGAQARFIEATAAHDLLKDPDLRARYDKGEIDASGAERQAERPFYRDYAQQPGNPYQSSRGFEGFVSSDIFEEILRQRGQGSARSAHFNAPGPDRRYQLELDFLEAALGTQKRITLPDGQSLDVRIPTGTADGQTIRLRGKGGEGLGEGPDGDALVTLSVRPHKLFRREGNDILLTLPISLDEAILGGKVEAPTIDGPVSLSIPKGASSGQVLRLRGRGVQRPGQTPRGDQRVELRIVSPPEMDESLRSFMESWRETHAYDPRREMMS
ncbi:DnaJ C-terminal domain-containing protein [Maricaulis salignorans]|uniref:DnaJ domain-containing protein n=1 Tax=Maricaulis salignorans TaxID=144026 RepID=A0A1G9P1U9_9PROT|nr:DnaJ C-terminal domain-containing protein [Maricaulis salignorans]SDL92654.1 DnaJ domain-containing protein [Maricaulis salignorans]